MTFARSKNGISSLRSGYSAEHDGIRSVSVTSFEGGTGTDGCYLENMIACDGALKCVSAPVTASSSLTSDASHAVTFTNGGELYFIAGGKVCRISNHGLVTLLSDALSSGGTFYKYGDSLLVTDAVSVLDVTGICREQTPTVPLVAVDCDSAGLTFTPAQEENLLTKEADVRFAVSDGFTRTVPRTLSVDEVISVKGRYGTLSSSAYSVNVLDGVATVTLSEASDEELTVRVRLSATHLASRTGALRALAGSGVLYQVGGDLLLGRYSKKLYRFKILGAAYISSDVTTLDTGEEITALLPYEDGWFVFSEGSVKRLSADADNMRLYPFQSDFGCDMPYSAVSDKDKIIFGNSVRGIFYIDRYDVTDKDVSRRVSAAVTDEITKTSSNVRLACAAVADGKYHLLVGGKLLSLDLTKKHPSASPYGEDEERRLVWSITTVTGASALVGAGGGRLWMIGADGVKFVTGAPGDTALRGKYVSPRLAPKDFSRKALCELRVSASVSGTAKLGIYCDGEETPYEYTIYGTGSDCIYRMRLPARSFCGAVITAEGASFVLRGIELRYHTDV